MFSQYDGLSTIRFEPPHVINDHQYDYPIELTYVINSEYNNSTVTYHLRTYILHKMLGVSDNQLVYWDTAEKQLIRGLTKVMFSIGMPFEFTINYIYEDFNDLLAGVYADWIVTVPSAPCSEEDPQP